MNRKDLLIISITIAVLLLVGCINYDQETVLNADNSGMMIINYTNIESEVKGEFDIPFSEPEIINSYEGSGLTIRDIVIAKQENLLTEVTYIIDFDDIDDLNGYGVFAIGDQIIQTFRILDEGDTYKFVQTVKIEADIYDLDLSVSTFKYKLTTQTPIISSDGKVSADNTTVTWTYPLTDIVNETTSMEVIYEKPASDSEPGGGMSVLWTILGIVGCFLIIIAIIIVIVVVMGKKKKKGPATE